MRKQLSVLSIFALGVVLSSGAAEVRADDDVYVDLSVLQELRSNNPPAYDSAPLFPIVNQTPERPSQAKAKKRSQSQRPKVEHPKVKVEVVERVVIPEKTVSVKGLKQDAPVVELQPVAENMETNAASPIAEIASESLPDIAGAKVDLSSETAQTAAQPIEEEAFSKVHDGQTELPQKSEPILQKTEVVSEEVEVLPAALPEAVKPSVTQQTENAVISKPELLIPVAPDSIKATDKQVFFNADSAELSNEQKLQIDRLVKSFADPHRNKIAIYSYNFDNGEDVFRKKRMSLNRAVEIRSYLLGQGYKNFSIKVINVTDEADKQNLVEIEELK